MLKTLIVEDNLRLQAALKTGLEATGAVQVVGAAARGEDAVEYCLSWGPLDVILMDVALAGEMNGISAAVAIRREYPRQPLVFYSIQDDDAYYRAFRAAGILSHYAYVRKSNYLLPEMIVPLLRDAVNGRSFVDPDVEVRIQEVRHRDANDPMSLLEPNEQAVARLLAQGLTNEQIASRLGLRDKRTISRTNGQIYTAWGLADSTTDEKTARTRAAIIVQRGQLIRWDPDSGQAFVLNARSEWEEIAL
jgi:DNA-binding NarL/FixJ family response regulator